MAANRPPWVPGAHNPSTIYCVSAEANGLRGLFCWGDGPWPANPQMSLGAMYALLALGFTMIYGIIELINFAHFNIFMVAPSSPCG
jgi:hypothetical protein